MLIFRKDKLENRFSFCGEDKSKWETEHVPEMQMQTSFVLTATPPFSLKRSNISTCKNREAFFCQQKTQKTLPVMSKRSNLKKKKKKRQYVLHCT